MQQQNDDKPPDLQLEKAKGGSSGGRTGKTAVGTGDGGDGPPSAPQSSEEGESVFDLAISVVEEVFLKRHGGANWQQAWPEAEACAMEKVNTNYGGCVSIDLVAAAIDQVISSYTVQEFTECGIDELCIMYPFVERAHLTTICRLVKVYGKHKPSPKV